MRFGVRGSLTPISGTPVNLPLADFSPSNDVTGDGIYMAAFTPSQIGEYSITITAQGTSPSGIPFSRTAVSSLLVIDSAAIIQSSADRLVDDNADTKIDRLVLDFADFLSTTPSIWATIHKSCHGSAVVPGVLIGLLELSQNVEEDL